MSASALFRPTFADLRAEIERRAAEGAPSDEINALIDQFLQTGGDSPAPWIEYDGTVTWFYRDPAAETVAVVGDILGYDPDRTRMTRLPGSDLFALTAQMPLDAWVEYAFLVDHARSGADHAGGWAAWLNNCRTDPLNPRQIIELAPARALSVLEMPNARPVPELDDAIADISPNVSYQVVGNPAGTAWARVWVFLPPSYDPQERRYPTLYLIDGESYLVSARAPQMMDALISQGEASPAVLVFVQRAERAGGAEDRLDGKFVQFLADELVPWIDARYATSTDPLERAIGGAGYNATLSLYTALERPHVFGQALAQSPVARSFVKAVPVLLARNAARGFGPPQCYIDVGRYEAQAVLESVHTLCTALINGGAAVSYQEFGGGHSFLGWRTTLPDALRFHFSTPALFASGID
ncbi:MAG TPA: alpha/beta hydrolase-fold protein [Roseiflexaceae bacterium]|nr:alpha/beta hydrolase-fold protein [Roseiflexaceae bacterium]